MTDGALNVMSAAECNLHRVQKVVNFGASVVTGARVSEHISPTVEALGWRGVPDLVTHRDSIGVSRALRDPRAPEAIRSLFTTRATDMCWHAGTASLTSIDVPPGFLLPRCLCLEQSVVGHQG